MATVGLMSFGAVLLIVVRDIVFLIARAGPGQRYTFAILTLVIPASLIYTRYSGRVLIEPEVFFWAVAAFLVIVTPPALIYHVWREPSPARRYTTLVAHLLLYTGFVSGIFATLTNFDLPIYVIGWVAGMALGFMFEATASLLPRTKSEGASPFQTQSPSQSMGRDASSVTTIFTIIGLIASILGIIDFVLNRMR